MSTRAEALVDAPRWRDARAFGLTAGGAAVLGLVAIVLERQGAGHRPVLAGLFVGFAAACALVPLRLGLPAIVVVAGFSGLLADLLGPRADYWNEAFVAALAVRALAVRRPGRLELAAAAVLAAIFVAYLAAGWGVADVFWGAKVLLAAAVAAWAFASLPAGRREWRAAYVALAMTAGANVLLAGWQRVETQSRLRELGVPDSHLIADAEHTLRAFGGLTSHAPLAYLLALAALCWLAFLVGSPEDRRLALATAWLAPAALVGIALSQNRGGALALCVGAVAVLAMRTTTRRLAPLVVAGLVLAATALVTVPGLRGAVSPAVDVGSTTTRMRVLLWGDYLDELSLFGAGPATAGSAYPRVHGHRPAPAVTYGKGWEYRADEARLTGSGTIEVPPRPRALVVRLEGRGSGVVHVATEHFALRWTLSPRELRPVAVLLRAGEGTSVIRLSTTARDVVVRHLRVTPAPRSRTTTEAVWRRWLVQAPLGAFSGGPGIVDSLYVSWLFQYGAIGVLIGLAWLAAVLWPLTLRGRDSLALAAVAAGVVMAVGAATLNLLEEPPVDLLAALVLGLALGAELRRRCTAQTDA